MTDIPYLTTDQMRAVDRAAIEDYHIELIQMMENAGRNLAHLARTRFLNSDPRGRAVVVLAGRGGNGGGGLVCARRLHNWGAELRVITTHPDAGFAGVPAHQLEILRRMGVPVAPALDDLVIELLLQECPPADVIADAIVGYSLSGPPRGAAARMIAWANDQDAPVLSLDIPSGADASSGQVHHPAIRATATLTLALPKEGLRTPDAVDFIGELYLADISVPPGLYTDSGLGLSVGPIFAREEVIRL